MPNLENPILNTERFANALLVATTLHARQARKGTAARLGSPVAYISHPLGVCSIAMGYGATEDEAIAALLHDVLEDVKPTSEAEAAVRAFGDNVYSIVDDCTNGLPGPDGHKAAREERVATYLAHLPTATRSACLVSASDKLHNARAIVADLRTDGDALWGIFKMGKDKQLAYYADLVTAFRANVNHHRELVDELARTVAVMHELAGSPQDLRT